MVPFAMKVPIATEPPLRCRGVVSAQKSYEGQKLLPSPSVLRGESLYQLYRFLGESTHLQRTQLSIKH